MPDRVFLRRATGELEQLETRSFLSESEVDALLARYPQLLASALSAIERPLRFLLVDSQSAIDDADGDRAGRWSADLVFLDNEGVLTIVEDKLSRNPDIRRKVIGQAIEYAANISSTWTGDTVQQRLSQNQGWEPAVADLLDAEELEGSDFWTRVTDNLQRGKLRLVFAADVLPRELRLAIEFLNQVSDPMEVAGVEVRELGAASADVDVVVASPVGVTERKREKTRATGNKAGGTPIDTSEFMDALDKLGDDGFCCRTGRQIVEAVRGLEHFQTTMYRTPGGEEVCRVSARNHDGLDLLRIRAISKNHAVPKCEISAPVMRQNWPDDLRVSLEQVIGEPIDLGRLTSLRDWLNDDESHGHRLLEWLLRVGQPERE